MNTEAFNHTSSKLKRANFLINELDESVKNFLRRKPYHAYLFEKRIGRQATYEFWFLMIERPPTDWPLVLGDAVHNLRVTLDVAANAVVELCNNRPKKVYFPFGSDQMGLEKQIKEKLGGATPALKDLVRSFQPYYGGSDALRDLHELDIIDKHREPLVHQEEYMTPELKLSGYDNKGRPQMDFSKLQLTSIDPASLPQTVKPGRDFTLLGKIDESTLVYSVVFARTLPLGGKPVVQTLRNLSQAVENIVESFKAHFFGERLGADELVIPEKPPSVPHTFQFIIGQP